MHHKTRLHAAFHVMAINACNQDGSHGELPLEGSDLHVFMQHMVMVPQWQRMFERISSPHYRMQTHQQVCRPRGRLVRPRMRMLGQALTSSSALPQLMGRAPSATQSQLPDEASKRVQPMSATTCMLLM